MMVRSSSASVVVVLSVATLMSMSAATNAPKVIDILANKEVQVALRKSWEEQEAYADSNIPNKYLVIQFQGTDHTLLCECESSLCSHKGGDIQLDNPGKGLLLAEEGRNYKVVADLLTQPLPGQSQKITSDDVSKSYKRGVPGIMGFCSGVFYYGPKNSASVPSTPAYTATSIPTTAGYGAIFTPTTVGYGTTSSVQYKGQKEVRIGELLILVLNVVMWLSM